MMQRSGYEPALGRAAALALFALFLACRVLMAAVGCDLNDPDRDVKRLFPDSTGYKTIYVSIAKKGGAELLRSIEDRLGDRFQGLFETADVPYTMYEVYRGRSSSATSTASIRKEVSAGSRSSWPSTSRGPSAPSISRS